VIPTSRKLLRLLGVSPLGAWQIRPREMLSLNPQPYIVHSLPFEARRMLTTRQKSTQSHASSYCCNLASTRVHRRARLAGVLVHVLSTRWSATLSSKVNLHHAIDFSATCGANWSRYPPKSGVNRTRGLLLVASGVEIPWSIEI